MIIRMLWAIAALFLLAFLVYESVVYGWAMGATVLVFALLPDVALIGAFDRERPGRLRPRSVAFYNLLHLPWIALGLIVVGLTVTLPGFGAIDDASKLVVVAGFAWLAHICCDRAFGYGLRDSDGGIRPVGGTRTPDACAA